MKYIIRIVNTGIVFLLGNPILWLNKLVILGLVIVFLLINLKPKWGINKVTIRRYQICSEGCELLRIFLLSLMVNIIYMIILFINIDFSVWLRNLLLVIIVEGIIFWNGILRIYLTASQLGIKWRIVGILCGWILILNIIILTRLIKIANDEVLFENHKVKLNATRINACLCQTKYPILLVHGVFFRDFEYFNYWGRIPEELTKNGAVIYYGNHQSAASITDSGKELTQRIKEIVAETRCQKLNIIAHSKGGLDCRYALSQLDVAPYVASLTTINTPHRGCVFADYLLEKTPEGVKNKVAQGYNNALKKLGDDNPDFIAAVSDLTASACQKFNQEIKDVTSVYYQSVGSKLSVASGGRFPLNFSHYLVNYFDGPNDGLVAETSFSWGAKYEFLTNKAKRGISHGDMIDLNRENIIGFDVREFYVQLVKERGY